MILEEETFEEFGYYPNSLGERSAKPILVRCDKCSKTRKTSKHSMGALCNSCDRKLRGAWKGTKNPKWKGEQKIKVTCDNCGCILNKSPSIVKRNKHNFCNRKCQGQWRSKDKKTKERLRRVGRCTAKPTKPERIFEQICQQNSIDFHYVGDGQLWIGKDKKLNPDFIEANGKRICVEIMGAYWHSLLLNPKIPKSANLDYRRRHYKKYKWIPFFIWDTDLLREDAEQFVLSELRKGGAI